MEESPFATHLETFLPEEQERAHKQSHFEDVYTPNHDYIRHLSISAIASI